MTSKELLLQWKTTQDDAHMVKGSSKNTINAVLLSSGALFRSACVRAVARPHW